MIRIVPFGREHSCEEFSCGNSNLDDWVKRYAGQSERRDTTRTFLAIADGSTRVLGYYATRTYELDLSQSAAAFGVGRRRYPVPAILLARLAVDRSVQGQGIGELLLVDALSRLFMASQAVGFEVVVVDAIDMDASAFYRRYGFQGFEDDSLHLFMTAKQLRATFAAASN